MESNSLITSSIFSFSVDSDFLIPSPNEGGALVGSSCGTGIGISGSISSSSFGPDAFRGAGVGSDDTFCVTVVPALGDGISFGLTTCLGGDFGRLTAGLLVCFSSDPEAGDLVPFEGLSPALSQIFPIGDEPSSLLLLLAGTDEPRFAGRRGLSEKINQAIRIHQDKDMLVPLHHEWQGE